LPDYRRWYHPGGTYFFTVVTQQRHPLFRVPAARDLLGASFRETARGHPFETIAIVLLWDHLHCVWALPRADADFSIRWNAIKGTFAKAWLASGGAEVPVTPSQGSRRCRGVWQPRFWEHLVRDEEDLERCCDYIHYNPVKHGYVRSPGEWPWSSFLRHVRAGQYAADWGETEPTSVGGMDWE
jgi:putative transposase